MMIIYNTTYHVSDEVEADFLAWMREQYIPMAVAEGIMTHPQFTLVMGSHHDGGTSYSLQLQAESVKSLQTWCLGTGKTLSARLAARFGASVVGFSTMLKQLEI